MLLSDVGVGLIVPSQNSTGAGYGHEVRPDARWSCYSNICCDSLSTSERKRPSWSSETGKPRHGTTAPTARAHSEARQSPPLSPVQPSPFPFPGCFYGVKLRQRCRGWRQILPRPRHAPVFSLQGDTRWHCVTEHGARCPAGNSGSIP